MSAEDYLPGGTPRLPRYDDHPISLRAERDMLKARVETLTTENSDLRARAEKAEAERDRLATENAALQAEIDAAASLRWRRYRFARLPSTWCDDD